MAGTSFRTQVVLELEDRVSREARRVERSVDAMNDEIRETATATASAQTGLSRFRAFLAGAFLGTIDEVARGVAAAWRGLQEALSLDQQSRALRTQLNEIGRDFDEFIGQLERTAQGTIATANIIESSSRALLLGIPADEIANLLEVATARAAQTGQTTAQAFDDIATGIGRLSPLILDNLGLTVDLTDAYQKYAEELGTTTDNLTTFDQRQAVANEVLQQGADSVRQYRENLTETARILQGFQATFTNAVTAIKNFGLAVVSAGLAVRQFQIAIGAELNAALANFTAFTNEALSNLPLVGGLFEEAARKSREFADEQNALADAAAESGKQLAREAGELAGLIEQQEKGRIVTKEMADAIQAEIDALRGLNQETDNAKDLTEDLNDTRRETPETIEIAIQGEQQYQRVLRDTIALQRTAVALGSSGLVARDSRNQLLIDQAFAAGNRPILGGTRINLPGGGSRLIR